MLRTRFLEDMQLHGYSSKTQSCYVGAVRGLAKHFGKSPDRITEEELRQYFLHLTLEKKVARATATIALCGIKFFAVCDHRKSTTHSAKPNAAPNPCLDSPFSETISGDHRHWAHGATSFRKIFTRRITYHGYPFTKNPIQNASSS